jgi:hypothetical protein
MVALSVVEVAESYSEIYSLNNSVAKSEGFNQCNTGFFLIHTLHSVLRLTKITKPSIHRLDGPK